MIFERYCMLGVLMLSLVLPLFACEMKFRLSGPFIHFGSPGPWCIVLQVFVFW
jgi:hypothetical protein